MIVQRADVAGRRATSDLQVLRLKRQGKAVSTTNTKPAARRALLAGRC